MRLLPALAVLLAATCRCPAADAADLDALEAFAWREARAQALDRFPPGSPERRYHEALLAQLGGDLERAEALLAAWAAERPGDEGLRRLRIRQAALWSVRDPGEACARLARLLAVPPPPPAPAAAEAPAAVLQVPPWEALRDERLAGAAGLAAFTAQGLARLLAEGADPERRRLLLAHLDDAALPGLGEAVLADLAHPGAAPFGALAAHGCLSAAQLDRLVQERPALAGERGWQELRLRRWAAADGGARAWDDAVLAADLDALAAALPPGSAAGVRAWAASWRLLIARRAGAPTEPHLRAWLGAQRVEAGALGAEEAGRLAGLPLPAGHQLLAELELDRHLAADGPAAWAALLPEGSAERRHALACLRTGAGDAAAALRLAGGASELAGSELAADPALRSGLAGEQPARLPLLARNLGGLRLRVFRLDPAAALDQGIPASAGAVPHAERAIACDGPAWRRLELAPELPECAAPGLYLVEAAGGGGEVRVLLRRGELHALVEQEADGVAVRVVDELGRPHADALAQVGETRQAAVGGRILLPLRPAAAARVPVLLTAPDGRCGRILVDWPEPRPRLEAGLVAPLQGLRAGAVAPLLLTLRVLRAGGALPLARLAAPRLELTWSGTERVLAAAALPLTVDGNGLARVEAPVPEGASELRWRALGEWELPDGPATLEHGGRIAFNGALSTREAWLLRRQPGGDAAVLECRDLDGTPRAGIAARLELAHRLAGTWKAEVRTGADGAVRLDGLAACRSLLLWQGDANGQMWHLDDDEAGALAIPAGAAQRLAAGGAAEARLLRLDRDGRPAGAAQPLPVAAGWVQLPALAAGDWRLDLAAPGGRAWRRRIAASAAVQPGRAAIPPPPALSLAAAEDADGVLLTVAGRSPGARVLALGLRAAPTARERSGWLAAPAGAASAWSPPQGEVAQRELDEGGRLALLRRDWAPVLGVHLPAPGVVVEPVAAELMRMEVDGEGPGAFGSRSGGGSKRALGRGGGSKGSEGTHDVSCWDWLAEPPLVLDRLVPDGEGRVRIARAALAGIAELQAVAVDGARVAQARLLLAAPMPVARERRLAAPIAAGDPPGVLAGVVAVAAGAVVELPAGPGARQRVIDDVAGLVDWLAAVHPGADLAEWRAVARWHRLDGAQRRALCARLASHELHLFLRRHDPAWFDRHLRGVLASRRQPSLVDAVLLGGDLAPWLAADRHARLNACERALLALHLPAAEAEAERRALVEAARAARTRGDPSQLVQAALEVPQAWLHDGTNVPNDALFNQPQRDDGFVLAKLGGGGKAKQRLDWQQQRTDPTLVREALWWRTAFDDQDADLIPVGPFWAELAAGRLPERGWEALGSPSAVRAALALAPLPLQAAAHRHEGARQVAGGPLLVVREAPAVLPPGEATVAVHGRLVDRALLAELAAGAPSVDGDPEPGRSYVHEVAVANLAPRQRTVQVLMQIPAGAVPLDGLGATAVRHLVLAPLASATCRLVFAWPRPGAFAQCGVSVSEDGRRLAALPGAAWRVAVPPPPPAADDLAWLRDARLDQVGLDARSWRLADPVFAAAALDLLRQRRRFAPDWWQVALHHRLAQPAGEWLRSNAAFRAAAGPVLDCPLVRLDELDDGWEPLLELDPAPLPPALRRAGHPAPAGGQDAALYRRLLERLAHRAAPDARDRLLLAVALLRQGRVDEARAQAAGAAPAGDTLGDYLAGWLALAGGDTALAQRAAAAHADHPLPRWRDRFAALAAAAEAVPPPAPALALAQDGDGRVWLRARACTAAAVRWRALDLEALPPFSAAAPPEALRRIAPIAERAVALAAGPLALDPPAGWGRRPALVEAEAGSLRSELLVGGSTLELEVDAADGWVTVRAAADGQVVPGAWVRVHRRDGDAGPVLHKEGRTDRAGRFPYAALPGRAVAPGMAWCLFIDAGPAGQALRTVAAAR